MKRFLRKIRFTKKQWLILAILLVALFWSGRGLYTMYTRYSQSKSDYERAQAELKNLANRQNELEKNIQHLETQRGIEAELRTRFNASKEGEELLVIVNDKGSASAATSTPGLDSWWKSVKDWFNR